VQATCLRLPKIQLYNFARVGEGLYTILIFLKRD